MPKLRSLALDHPRATLGLAALAMLACVPGLFFLELRTDGHALVPPADEAVHVDAVVRERFGIEDPLVVLLRSVGERGVYEASTFALIRDLTTDLERLSPGSVVSLATEKGYTKRKGLGFETFLESLPETAADFERVRSDLEALEIYHGTIISRDETAAAIFVGVPADADRIAFYGEVVECVEARPHGELQVDVIGAPASEALLGIHLLEDLGLPPSVFGITAQTHGERSWGIASIGMLPVALAIMALVFLISFRSLWGMILPLMEVGVCLVMVFGIMGYLGVPVYLTIAVMPVILTALGVADEIHLFSRYAQIRRRDPTAPAADAVRAAVDEVARPIIKTSLTTAVGFLSFTLSPLVPVQVFGWFTALGILLCMVWSLTAMPALIALTGPSLGRSSDRPRLARILPAVGRLAARYRVVVVLAFLLLVAGVPFGIRLVIVQDSWIDGFAEESRFRRATSAFDRSFHGVHVLLIHVLCDDADFRGELPLADLDYHEVRLPGETYGGPLERLHHGWLEVALKHDNPLVTDPKYGRKRWSAPIESIARDPDGALRIVTPKRSGSARFLIRPEEGEILDYRVWSAGLLKPRILRALGSLADFVRTRTDDQVGGVLGPADYLETTQYMQKNLRPGSRRIPDDPKMVRIAWHNYSTIRGKPRFAQLVTENYSETLITVFLKSANFRDTARLISAIEGYEQEHLAGLGVELQFAGDVAVSQASISAIVSTQVRSLVLSLVGIFAIAVLLTRPLRLSALGFGFWCVLPSAFAIAANFAVMGFAGVPLGVATSMFAGMTLGIGVDFAIHLVEKFRRGLAAGLDRSEAMSDALGTTGPAIATDGCAVALAFGILILSQVPANARLGLLSVAGIAFCMFTTLLLLPAVLGRTPSRSTLLARE